MESALSPGDRLFPHVPLFAIVRPAHTTDSPRPDAIPVRDTLALLARQEDCDLFRGVIWTPDEFVGVARWETQLQARAQRLH